MRGAERGRGKVTIRGSETISRPVEISEKLISIQTDAAGCRGWVCAERGIGVGWGQVTIYQKMASNGWQKEMPEGSGKDACERNTCREARDTERKRQALETQGRESEWHRATGRAEGATLLNTSTGFLHCRFHTACQTDTGCYWLNRTACLLALWMGLCVRLLLSPCPGMFCCIFP